MRKKILAAVLCLSMGLTVCGCRESKKPEQGGTVTPQITGTETSPITDYDDYLATTILPEKYLGIEVDAITEAEIEAYIQEILEGNKERELKDGPLEEGDIAIINYVGYLDGVTFEGGSDFGVEVEVGNSGFIDGFDEGLIGAKKGETKILDLKFPDPYERNPDLAGKDVMFEVKINSAAAQITPEFTDEFITNWSEGEYTSAEAYREDTVEYLTQERIYLTVTDYLVENSAFVKINEEFVQEYFEAQKLIYAEYYGFSDVASLEEYLGEEGSNMLWTVIEEKARRDEQARVALYCVAIAENMTLTEDEFTKSATELAASEGMTLEVFLAQMGEKAVRQELLMMNALNYVMDNVVMKGEE